MADARAPVLDLLRGCSRLWARKRYCGGSSGFFSSTAVRTRTSSRSSSASSPRRLRKGIRFSSTRAERMKMRGGVLGVDVAVGDLAALHFQAVQGDDLLDQHIARARAPVRILVRDLAAMRRELEDPLRINARHGAGEELGGLDDFTGDNPLAAGSTWAWAAACCLCVARLLRRLAARRKAPSRGTPITCRLPAAL